MSQVSAPDLLYVDSYRARVRSPDEPIPSAARFQAEFPDERACTRDRWPDGFFSPNCRGVQAVRLKSQANTFEYLDCWRQSRSNTEPFYAEPRCSLLLLQRRGRPLRTRSASHRQHARRTFASHDPLCLFHYEALWRRTFHVFRATRYPKPSRQVRLSPY